MRAKLFSNIFIFDKDKKEFNSNMLIVLQIWCGEWDLIIDSAVSSEG